MARKALHLTKDFLFDGTGSGESFETNAKKIDDSLAEVFQDILICDLAPNSSSKAKVAPPAARTVAKFEAKCHTALETGTIQVTLKDADGNALLAATIDATTLTASFVEKTLTATSANLDIAAGEPVTMELTSNSGSSTGGPVIGRITWAAAADA